MKSKKESNGSHDARADSATVRQIANHAAQSRAKDPDARTTPPHPHLRELQSERSRLMREIRDAEIVTQDHPTTGNHMADDASEVFEQTKNLALKQHLEKMLEQVNLAILRIEKGTYGICERCRSAIGIERLKALPYATLCINCASGKTRPAPA